MRVDKWLWAMRIYKTRSIATDACKNNRVSIGGMVAKPAREVRVGDTVTVKKMPVVYSFKIIDLPKSRQGAANVPLFMKNITPQSELDKLDQKIAVFVKRDRGTGRPTKKERRDIDVLMGGSSFDGLEWDDELDDDSDDLSDDANSSIDIDDEEEDCGFNF